MYLLNDAKDILQDISLEMFMDGDNKMDENVEKIEKQKYEQDVIECKKLRTFI